MVFRVGSGDEFALPIERVQEVVQFTAPRPIASRVPWVLGVMSLRGSVLPVWDLAVRLGMAPSSEPERLLISARADGAAVALAVADVTSIRQLPEGSIEPLVVPGAPDAAVAGVAHLDGGIVVVLDPDHLLEAPHPTGPDRPEEPS